MAEKIITGILSVIMTPTTAMATILLSAAVKTKMIEAGRLKKMVLVEIMEKRCP